MNEPNSSYPSDSLDYSVRIRQAVQTGLSPVHVTTSNSMSASAFMNMIGSSTVLDDAGESANRAAVDGDAQGDSKAPQVPHPSSPGVTGPVDNMLSLEQELAHLSAELGLYSATAKAGESGAAASMSKARFGRRAGKANPLASSFAAAAALDGSFCVVPSQDLLSERNLRLRTLGGNKRQRNIGKGKIAASDAVGGSPQEVLASSAMGGQNQPVALQKLLNTLQTLMEENASLLRENESIRQMKVEADEAKEVRTRSERKVAASHLLLLAFFFFFFSASPFTSFSR